MSRPVLPERGRLLFTPDRNWHPENERHWFFGDDDPDDTVDRENEGYEQAELDAPGFNVIEGFGVLLWVERDG